jgi:hypothetical protein
MNQPTVNSAQFESPDPDAPGGPWVLALHVQGEGFYPRGFALFATVGDVNVQAIVEASDGSGFIGFLATQPADGAVLSVGYEDMVETSVTYQSSGQV